MARATKKTVQEAAWEHYRAVQLTPEERAAARAVVQERLNDPATQAGYDRLVKLIGKIKFSDDWDELMSDDD